MKQIISSAVLWIVLASTASAQCYVDYKAKRDNPLRLHYGVIEVPEAECSSRGRIETYVASRLKRANWQLLTIVSVLGEDEVNDKRAEAGEHFLRY